MLTNETYLAIMDNLYEGVYFVDMDRRITYWNKGAERITGYSAAEVAGKRCADNVLAHINDEGKCLCTSGCPLQDVIQQQCSHREDQIYLHHKDGYRIPVTVSISLIRDASGVPIGAAEVFCLTKEINQDAKLIESLKRETLLDMLTELPNRRYLQMNLTGSLAEYERHGNGFGLVFADVDHFKNFNDTYGHDIGDKVLLLVGKTMANCVRAYDMVGRWGGEEFLAIIRFTDEEQFIQVAEKIRHMVEQTFLMHGNEKLNVTITLGATHVRPEDTVESLVNRADRLM